jgi:hypothetical protein
LIHGRLTAKRSVAARQMAPQFLAHVVDLESPEQTGNMFAELWSNLDNAHVFCATESDQFNIRNHVYVRANLSIDRRIRLGGRTHGINLS